MLITLLKVHTGAVGEARLDAGDQVATTTRAAHGIVGAFVLERIIDVQTGLLGMQVVGANPTADTEIAIGYLTFQAQFVRDAWDFIAAAMIENMDLGYEQGKESRHIVLEHLDWLDAELRDGREYLVGETFSRVDVCAAALLAPLSAVPEHPTYGGLSVPPALATDIANWENRAVTQYVGRMYRQHRNGY